jgi:hypothetical protein
MPSPPYQTPGDRAAALAFFRDRDAAHALFRAVVARVAGWGPFELAATRSRVSCVARTRFLWVHEANEDGAIWLGFLLPHALGSPRVRSGRHGGRWSHHVKVASEADLDGEFLGWLREAYESDVAGVEGRTTAPRAAATRAPSKAAAARRRR